MASSGRTGRRPQRGGKQAERSGNQAQRSGKGAQRSGRDAAGAGRGEPRGRTGKTSVSISGRAFESRRIVMLTFPDGQILDVVGPLEVFATASRLLAERARPSARAPAYGIEIVALQTGPVRMASGLEVVASRSLAEVRGSIDTLLVGGGFGTREALQQPPLVDWIARASRRSRRVASVCTGTFLLAEAGLLDGRRVTTHWSACEMLAKRHPAVEVDPDPIYVKDGDVWSSAGVTAGMDLALALVEEDHGRDLALEVARYLVLFLKRPGGQSQFSAQLDSQLAEREGLRELQSWIVENPAADLSIEALARHSAMSPRNFARVFAAEVGVTPARYVERIRVEAARRLLEDSEDSLEAIAERCGFGSSETLRRALLRAIRVGPAEYRRRFRSADHSRTSGSSADERSTRRMQK